LVFTETLTIGTVGVKVYVSAAGCEGVNVNWGVVVAMAVRPDAELTAITVWAARVPATIWATCVSNGTAVGCTPPDPASRLHADAKMSAITAAIDKTLFQFMASPSLGKRNFTNIIIHNPATKNNPLYHSA
jgi:hypothetical protein